MDVAMNLLGVSVLILIFVILLIISNYGKKPTRFKKPSKKERRACPRYKTSLRIKYATSIEEGVSWIKDISEKGARLFLNNTLKTLEVGESLGIEINLPYDTQPVFIQGNIVWFEDDDAGFQFEKIVQEDINRIIQYVSNGEQI